MSPLSANPSPGQGPPSGNLDPLNAAKGLFPAANPHGIPEFLPEEPRAPDFLIPYRTRIQSDNPPKPGEAAVHFFLEDRIFEPVWNRPSKGLSYVSKFGLALSPDFSLYPVFPLALNLYNVYRSRWVGRYWQEHGVSVIPSVSWSDASSYAYCFLGIPECSAVALSTVGVGHKGDTGRLRRVRDLFRAGYEEMVRRLDPSLVLVYGEVPLERFGIEESPPLRTYPSRWQNIRRARREARQRAQRGTPSGA